MKADISIVMPVYNGGAYITHALKDISNQSFQNFEVIIINDGSTDNTREVAENFIEEDKRFKLFNEKKGGVASARNYGIKKASGDYIIHYDVDDRIPTDALEVLYKEAVLSQAGIILGDYQVIVSSLERYVSQNFKGSADDFIQGLLYHQYHGALWNKLIRRELYRGVIFDEDINFMEDMHALVQILSMNKPEIRYVPKIVYHYIQNGDSVTNALSANAFDSFRKVIEYLENTFALRNVKFDLDLLKLHYKLLALRKGDNIEYTEVFKEVNDKVFSTPNLSLKYRFFLFIMLTFGECRLFFNTRK
ncbi:glycosyltransferase family 2 protein [Desertivirga xinjiangensis]|uniref:glycosyltransferase family 2 protein n=1 Tax=Desertivirga xinjiangensis TaxID=539206 RepID=UPI00210B34E0|nr:glycosyltransferase family 2 protein [Pedobacter xinjiangensis]